VLQIVLARLKFCAILGDISYFIENNRLFLSIFHRRFTVRVMVKYGSENDLIYVINDGILT